MVRIARALLCFSPLLCADGCTLLVVLDLFGRVPAVQEIDENQRDSLMRLNIITPKIHQQYQDGIPCHL